MRDEYAGDIGDFGKLALLRHLSKGRKLGECWYKTSYPSKQKNDGKHTSYLTDYRGELRCLDPPVLDALKKLIHNPPRCIAALQRSGLLRDAIFHDAEVPIKDRSAWTEAMKAKVSNCDLIFLDPDNGIEGRRLTRKHVALSEIIGLRQKNRVLVIYHHQGRRVARDEAQMLRLKVKNAGWSPVELIRFRLFSSRFYIIAGPDSVMRRSIQEFAKRWGDRVEHFP
jgi:hypothetical protein